MSCLNLCGTQECFSVANLTRMSVQEFGAFLIANPSSFVDLPLCLVIVRMKIA
jgi:hypothetical protein